MSKKALITGIAGQDGAYLAKLLLEKNYSVYGTVRHGHEDNSQNLQTLELTNKVKIIPTDLTNRAEVAATIAQVEPDEIYHLAGQSSVGVSFGYPYETISNTVLASLNLLEVIRINHPHIKFFNASSSECFGDTKGVPADESAAMQPVNPYGVAKTAAYFQTKNYRETYGLFTASGILFNHESPLRPEQFVTQKIILGAIAIAIGKEQKLELGNLDIARDWGYAPEYVDAMWRMLQQKEAEDFVIATGITHTLKEFVHVAFNYVGLDARKHVVSNNKFKRALDIAVSAANPKKAANKLSWKAQTSLEEIVSIMMQAHGVARK